MDCGNHVNTITSWIAVKQTVTTSPSKRYKKEDVIAIFYRKKTSFILLIKLQINRIINFNRPEPTCYRNLYSIHQFRLTNWTFFVHNTMRNASYYHLRLDMILELCRTFLIGHKSRSSIYIGELISRNLPRQFRLAANIYVPARWYLTCDRCSRGKMVHIVAHERHR